MLRGELCGQLVVRVGVYLIVVCRRGGLLSVVRAFVVLGGGDSRWQVCNKGCLQVSLCLSVCLTLGSGIRRAIVVNDNSSMNRRMRLE